MKFFVDTADTAAIRDLAATGLLDGVTTNPSLVAKTGRNFFDILKEICELVPGPVSAEVAAVDLDGMLREADLLRKVADNITIKVPLTIDGLKACKRLTTEGTMVNVTLCFSSAQALLAAKAGAWCVSPFIGRLDDVSSDGMALIRQIIAIYKNYSYATYVLVASVRHPQHVVEAALAGGHICTMPYAVFQQLVKHPLTDVGLKKFLADWESRGQK